MNLRLAFERPIFQDLLSSVIGGRPSAGKWFDRRVRSLCGCSLTTITFLWLRIGDVFDNVRGERKHLVWALCFLKLYDNETALATRFHTTEKTFRQWTKEWIKYLAGADLVSRRQPNSQTLITK
jgi:hypothetical protein